jgi:hypothetical protein
MVDRLMAAGHDVTVLVGRPEARTAGGLDRVDEEQVRVS